MKIVLFQGITYWIIKGCFWLKLRVIYCAVAFLSLKHKALSTR